MFNNCKKITKLPKIKKWDMKNVKDKRWMFRGCSGVKEIIIN